MKIKHAVMIGMLGLISDRFHVYHSEKDFYQRLELIKQIQESDGIEIVYPTEFADINQTIKIIKDSGVTVSAVNLNIKSEKRWENGAFTSPDPKIRAASVNELKIAMDIAAELGTDMVSCCPLIDGHNYNFEVDYLNQWNWLEEGIAEGSKHRGDIRVSMEYKLNEARNFNILSDMGRTLYLCQRIGLPNVGVTMDVGHALIGKETPAEVLTLAAQAGRLFYVHFNDNGREWDWDMLPGSVNLWDLLEMIFYLERLNWDGWFAYDIFTRNGDPVENMSASISIIESAIKLVHKIGLAQLQEFINESNSAYTFTKLWRALI